MISERTLLSKFFRKRSKSPIRRKWTRNIKATKIRNQKIIVKIIDKIGNHGEASHFMTIKEQIIA